MTCRIDEMHNGSRSACCTGAGALVARRGKANRRVVACAHRAKKIGAQRLTIGLTAEVAEGYCNYVDSYLSFGLIARINAHSRTS